MFPDGRRVVSASNDNTLKVWDVATGACVATLEGHDGWVTSVHVFPGDAIISSSNDRTIKVWHPTAGTWNLVTTLRGHASSVRDVAVLPNGRRVVSASEDGSLKLWGCA